MAVQYLVNCKRCIRHQLHFGKLFESSTILPFYPTTFYVPLSFLTTFSIITSLWLYKHVAPYSRHYSIMRGVIYLRMFTYAHTVSFLKNTSFCEIDNIFLSKKPSQFRQKQSQFLEVRWNEYKAVLTFKEGFICVLLFCILFFCIPFLPLKSDYEVKKTFTEANHPIFVFI